mmetsp:Transcript_9341/g.16531  ORF Transcript_9341/g.16531 Transcript_9341/m.16531 type:complete len:257 (-) Transcript_9341:222-992(-)|eukprot:CAMPEP_0197622766 /NCGR_PEP_ID=MMETSP1338-20131121/2925_1 /TAXON_ID=43686 ORGANISM="Pelagodinium beii, Strain RCC1491" /NCGR_SAMPLE_ID=MMETSP1338 /ASSEMBLY_ACC=CAM_ASM_000754 /LENGTH=256 /DNA_ID=CAMNT_0043192519 /DNA_START=45 /DNA_END=815 /DNA_ORIENTATION=+
MAELRGTEVSALEGMEASLPGPPGALDSNRSRPSFDGLEKAPVYLGARHPSDTPKAFRAAQAQRALVGAALVNPWSEPSKTQESIDAFELCGHSYNGKRPSTVNAVRPKRRLVKEDVRRKKEESSVTPTMHKLWTTRHWKLPSDQGDAYRNVPRGSAHVQFEPQQPALPALKRVATAPTGSLVRNAVDKTPIPQGPLQMIKYSLEQIGEDRQALETIGRKANLEQLMTSTSALPGLRRNEKIPLAYLARQLETVVS